MKKIPLPTKSWRYYLRISGKLLIALLFYLFILAYAFLFNNTTGWFLFWLATFFYLGLSLRLLASLRRIHVSCPEVFTIHSGEHTKLPMTFTGRGLQQFYPALMITLHHPTRQIQRDISFWHRGKLGIHFAPFPRGTYQDFSLTLASCDLLGIALKEQTRPFPLQLTVLPYDLAPQAKALFQFLYLKKPQPFLGDAQKSYDLKNFRRYEYRDGLRQIDWKVSARLGEVVVRELENEPLQEMALVFYGADVLHIEENFGLFYSFTNLLEEQRRLLGSLKDTTVTYHLLGKENYQVSRVSNELWTQFTPSDQLIVPAIKKTTLLLFVPDVTLITENPQLQKLVKDNDSYLLTLKKPGIEITHRHQTILLPKEVAQWKI